MHARTNVHTLHRFAPQYDKDVRLTNHDFDDHHNHYHDDNDDNDTGDARLERISD